ncbi:MAG: type II toxin-antitoxin system VapC family toxin [Pirellulales bacterium]
MTAKERYVLDGSVALAWCFADEADSYATAIAKRFPNAEALVPAIWPLEIANALLMGERRKRSTPADTLAWTSFLKSLPITVDDETNARAWSDTLLFARDRQLSAYDAAYLELAVRQGLPLATLDTKLKKAAAGIGVRPYRAPSSRS